MVIASGQTGWFIIQCGARYHAGLNVTLLELTAFAFSILNVITWSLWVHKPHHVRLPIHLDYKGDRIQGPDFDKIRDKASSSTTPQGTGHEDSELSSSEHQSVSESEAFRLWIPSSLIRPLLDAMGLNAHGPRNKSVKGLYTVENVRTYYTTSFTVSDRRTPGGPEGTNKASKGHTPSAEHLIAISGAAVAALIFGAIHCAGWASIFEFPTNQERLLWKVSSIIMISTSVTIFLVTLLYFLSSQSPRIGEKGQGIILTVLLYAVSIPYVIARLVLLFLAFTSIRSLPPSAYDTIRWISAFPHL
ncbi:hypothetical protein AX16_008581 [Volvariella volvacea WC 439]|nr:hypothetical protein AX16_008581 [Volvariella volvacea WC 439]